MVKICIFSPFPHTESALMDIAEREGIFECFGDGERDRINKISNPIGKALSLGGLCALGRAVNELGFSDGDIYIVRDKFGKPRFAGGSPYFSIAHGGDLSVAAVSRSGVLGVDIERIDQSRDTRRIASKFFSAAEQEQLAEAVDKVREFYRIWTAKEAMMKQGGEGMISIMSSDSALAAARGERCFKSYGISFAGEEYILTVCTYCDENIETLVCDALSISKL